MRLDQQRNVLAAQARSARVFRILNNGAPVKGGQVHTNTAPTAQKHIREDARLSFRQVRRAA
jgi:hypothetical protein